MPGRGVLSLGLGYFFGGSRASYVLQCVLSVRLVLTRNSVECGCTMVSKRDRQGPALWIYGVMTSTPLWDGVDIKK